MGWRFELSNRPFDRTEKAVLSEDLHTLGVDDSLLDLYSATVACRSRLTRPLILRALDRDRLAGAAVVTVCRDSGRSFFFSPRLVRSLRLGPPIWYWERASLGTDGHAGPGLVAPGVTREEFAEAAARRLSSRYLAGAIVESPTENRDVRHVDWPGAGVSTVPVDASGSAAMVGEHKNLARKIRKFANHGGRLQITEGPMPASVQGALLAGYRIDRPLNPPFVELYPQLVRRHWSLDGDRLVHLIASIDDQPVGYHSFWRSGTRLILLSGVFGRPDGGTQHAYESILLASIDLAAGLGCAVVEFGTTVNAAKASLLGRSATNIRFVSQLAPVRTVLRKVLPVSALKPDRVAAATGG
jgi:hypothetical protein